MRISIFIAGLTLCVALTACNKPDVKKVEYNIWIQNQSNADVALLISPLYPDTAVPDLESSILIIPMNTEKAYSQPDKWETFFEKLPKDTISLFFMNTDTLAKYSFQEIRDKYLIQGRADIGLEYLKAADFTLIYK